MGTKLDGAFSKVVVLVCLIMIVAFTVAIFWMYFNGHTVPDILIGSWFVCFGVEFASLASVKNNKTRANSRVDIPKVEESLEVSGKHVVPKEETDVK